MVSIIIYANKSWEIIFVESILKINIYEKKKKLIKQEKTVKCSIVYILNGKLAK